VENCPRNGRQVLLHDPVKRASGDAVKPVAKQMIESSLATLRKDRQRLSLLLLIMAAVAVGAGSILVIALYKTAFERQRAHLVETAQTHARMIESMARYHARQGGSEDPPGRVLAVTLPGIADGLEHLSGFGETGEFLLSKQEGDRIVILLSRGPHEHELPGPILFSSKPAEPMRRALTGESGTVVGLDHHGERVLAAYEPIVVLGLGIVAKIDLAEIRAPFVRAGLLASGGAVLLVFIGTALFMRIANPLIRHLEEREMKYRALFDSATEGVFVMGDVFEDCNQQACHLYACEREDIIGHTPLDFSPPRQPDGRDSIEAARERIESARAGKPQFFYWKHQRKDGVLVDVDVSLHAVEIGDRKVLVAAVRDISDRARAEQRLHLQGAALESAANGVVITDREGTIQWVNPAFTRMTGYTAEEAIGKKPSLTKSGEHDPFFYRNLWTTILAGRTWHGEIVNRHKNGALYPEEQTITPVFDSRGEISHFVSIKQDVTARKVAERALQEKSEELERSNRELEQFAHVASHDLQEPLRTVGSYVQLLARRYKGRLDADADDFIRFTVEGADRMQQMIRELLDYARVGTQGKPAEVVPGQAIVEEAVGNLNLAIQEAGAQVSCDPLPTLQVDRGQFVRLFQNLIGNAVKFRGEAPLRIHIGVLPQSGAWHFSVQDNGPGIDPRYLERIFRVFQRLHERDAYPGTGMGLALCRKIVECHGGRMWAESAEGRGATIHFTIPIASPS
jgi:PAS domain S-box-containing protein